MKFGTDGVRGLAGSDLTAAFALQLGRAAARQLGGRQFVIGGDTRLSTPMLEAAFVAGVTAEGVEAVRLGVVPTPLVAFESARRQVPGAMISASHNPFHDNGIKLFAAGGSKLPDEVEARIEQDVQALPDAGFEVATVSHGDGSAPYLDHLAGAIDHRSLDGLRVVVDAANGAASGLAAGVFAAAGADVIVIHADPDGRNINEGCGATEPAALAEAVLAHEAALGLALDGDADRLIAVDHHGAVVDGDHIIGICALDRHRAGTLAHDTVVVTVMTNLGFRLGMEAAGVRVVETAVGDRYVLEALDAGGFDLGGEQSGHVIFRDRSTTGDGLMTGLVVADIVVRSGRSLAELAAATMTRLPQVLVNVPVARRIPDAAERLADEIGAVEAVLGDHGRVLVRASGTEPLIRVMVEAPTADEAQRAADTLAASARALD